MNVDEKSTRSALAQPHALGCMMHLGTVLAGSHPGHLLVLCEGENEPIAAQTTLGFDEESLAQVIQCKQQVVLLVGSAAMPIVIGLIAPTRASQMLAAMLDDASLAPASLAPESPATLPLASALPQETRIYGRRIILEGKDEVQLKCGNASIILQRDGATLIKGATVTTQAKGLNRIKGASVKIN